MPIDNRLLSNILARVSIHAQEEIHFSVFKHLQRHLCFSDFVFKMKLIRLGFRPKKRSKIPVF